MAASYLLSAVLVSLFVAEASPASDCVTFEAPTDGGTPRDTSRIVSLGNKEFRILASVEEGKEQSFLRHAVSRIDLICHNAGFEPVDVTLHLDLSDDGRRTSFDDKPEAGMLLRDFVFIQPAGGDWQQVDGTTAGWVATVRFSAPPGDTKLGLAPWYTYADYLNFIQRLPEHPHLAREQFGRSDGGREHWELKITDPAVPAEHKRLVYWHAREHAYESFSSFAMEGLAEYLLSQKAADMRRKYIVVLHPMTNVDGVAEGYEYRGGYDLPKPRATATGRLTFETVDRLRPDFAVAWHNWNAPRDRDVVFYTDAQAGKPTRRAWDLFTQRFRTPRSAGHRWRDETNPMKYNWSGRQSLSDGNVHQYAMKHYGTSVWGWEMPWWNRSTADARQAGRDFGIAFLTTLDQVADEESTGVNAAPEPQAASEAAVSRLAPAPTGTELGAERQAEPVETPRWEMHEFTLHGAAHVDNPFRDAALVGEFVAPSGKVQVAEGFFDGGDTWRLRFAPDEVGEWSYRLRGEGVALRQTGKMRCTAARSAGFIGIHPENPYAFAYADGSAFFPMGDTCYGLFDDSPISPELRAAYLKLRREQRFNFVRVSVGHSRYRAADDPSNYWAWGGTPDRPDLDRFNPAFFRGFDSFLRQLQAAGMNVEMLVLNMYRKPFTDPENWTRARERLWIRHLLARYAAFSNVFLWTVSNEYELFPDGKYRLDNPRDPEWAKSVARTIKQFDPYRHPVTVHPVVSANTKSSSPKGAFSPPWRIGEFFGEGSAIDVLSQQTGQFGEGTLWDEQHRCWVGDSATVADSIHADRRYGKPVLNSENGYEYRPGGPTEKRQVHHSDKVRRSSWRIVCAGGYFAAGYNGTIGHSDGWNRIDAPNRYTFVLNSDGAYPQLGYLYEFFTALPYWKMQPFDGVTGELAVALAVPGEVYVAYLPRGGAGSVDLTGIAGRFSARWFNPRQGSWGEAFGVEAGYLLKLAAPDEQDWALVLERRPAEGN